ncbi:MAG TPA: hypothetical protein VFY73_20490 [Ideonella sp.]|uniref:glycine-rich domain-containing protein n=1 Tax=Ideonella sp. TaxID=1929293 RepID=UPI002E3210BD|nr:hypothetical protein [Ideonella sp.]HEX5686414.1 hypothetical protein [Ideonella sp.]
MFEGLVGGFKTLSPFIALVLLFSFVWWWRRDQALRREVFIRETPLPHGLFEALRKRRPDLGLKDCQLVASALRQFFLAHLKSGRRYVSMPSQVADELWHEFILHTRNYDEFCRRAFGRFLHHTPAAALGGAGSGTQSNAGLRRCWWYVCKLENINPRQPTRLPLLFALDHKLGIAGGFVYALDCTNTLRRSDDGSAVVHCGAELGSSGEGSFGDGGGSCGGGSDGGSSDGGGSGCGGGGCGGGGD